jgi:transcriptional regulator with XRE-family HTH domain
MDILEKISKLQKERGWSVYRLSYEAGLTQSTVANMFKRKTLPSIPTLKALCDAFGITLSEFFKEENETVNDTADSLLAEYSSLTPAEKKAVAHLITDLSHQ